MSESLQLLCAFLSLKLKRSSISRYLSTIYFQLNCQDIKGDHLDLISTSCHPKPCMLLIWLQWINILSLTQHISLPPWSFWELLDRSQTSWCHCWLLWIVSVWLPFRSFSQTGKNSNLEVRNLYSDLTGSAVKSRNSQQLIFLRRKTIQRNNFQ